jgi:hypothetical protein
MTTRPAERRTRKNPTRVQRAGVNHQHPTEDTVQFIQPELFPITDLQTRGYAQPEPREDETVADDQTVAEAA